MAAPLTHLNVGDYVATAGEREALSSFRPQITNHIWQIQKKTATQMTCQIVGGTREIRVRIIDGKIIGQNYRNAIEATPEIIAARNEQVRERNRYIKAESDLEDLIGKGLHLLKLNTAQIEALAEAWTKIKEMA